MNQPSDSVDKNIVDVRKKRNASSSAVRDFRTRLASVGSGHFAYEIDLMKGFARNQVNAGFAMPILVLLVGLVMSSWIGWIVAVFWVALAGLSHILLSILSRRFLGKERTQEDLPRWRRNFLFAQVLIAVAWTFFASNDCGSCNDIQYSVIQFSTILVFQAVATMLTYSYGRSVLIMAAPASLVLSVRFIRTYDPATIIMGAILVAAILFFFLFKGIFNP